MAADFFIINLSDSPVLAVFKFHRPIEELIKDSLSIKLKYADTILKVNNKTEGLLKSKLNSARLNDSTFSIELPPKSTVLVGAGLYSSAWADSVIITDKNETHRYSLQQILGKSKRKGGGFLSYHFTYTVAP